METQYLASVIQQFRTYKGLVDKALLQLPNAEGLYWKPDPASNSIAIIMQHLIGNLHSRWTNFLTTDGEKPWRNRDFEFEEATNNREELSRQWEAAWQVLFTTLEALQPGDILQTVKIRGEAHTVLEAINRQLTHYAYHVGQVVLLSKAVAGADFASLSIPKGNSAAFNEAKFAGQPVV